MPDATADVESNAHDVAFVVTYDMAFRLTADRTATQVNHTHDQQHEDEYSKCSDDKHLTEQLVTTRNQAIHKH